MNVLIAGVDKDTRNYQAALRALGVPFDVKLTDIDFDAYDRLVLPGGGDIAPWRFGQEDEGSTRIDEDLDEKQLSIFNAFHEAGKPILGICRGFQVINVALGGDLIQDLPTAAFHRQIVEGDKKSDNHHSVRVVEGSLMERLYGKDVPVNSCHHQGLGKIGEGLRVTMWSEDGVAEAFEHVSAPILGTQWHPERTGFAFRSDEAVDGQKVWEAFLALR